MEILNLIEKFLTDSHFTNYIIAGQIPTVACLGIMCFIAYKLGFNEFKLISYAWGINLTYLITNIILKHIYIGSDIKMILRTSFDLISSCLFLISILNFLIANQIWYFKKITRSKALVFIISIAILVGFIKILPVSFRILPYIHLRYFPSALFDFFVLLFLSKYFKSLEEKFLENKYLSIATFLYAILQFLSIAQNDKHEPNIILLNIDNIGFLTGLMLKMFMLLFLSRLIVYAVRATSIQQKELLLNTSIEEKELLLTDFSKASNRILDIEKNNPSANHNERENIILDLALTKLLELLKKNLGYFSFYDEKSKQLEIKFTSKGYITKVGYKYSIDIGLTGEAVVSKRWVVMNSLKESKGYRKFDDLEKLDDKVNSALAFPLILDDKVLGVFMIECEKENCFTDLDISIVDSLIYQATVAIKNNRLIHDLEISKVFLDSLKQIDKQIVFESHNTESVLSFILKNTLQLVNCDSGNIDIVRENKLICIASTNKKNINEENDIDDCLSGLAVINKQTQYFSDLENLNQTHKKLYKERLGTGYKCELVVPLIIKNDEVIGVFNTESKEVDKFTQEDIDKIDGLAGQTAIVIYITKLIEDIKEKNRILEHSVDVRNIEMSFLLGHLINHRIGNEVGIIRLILMDLLAGYYGEFNENVKAEFNLMLECAQKALIARTEIRQKVKELIMFNPTKIDFMQIKLILENNENVKPNCKITITGFNKLKPVYVNPDLLIEAFLELLSNSIKSMPNGGEVLINGNVDNEFDIISFTDHGCGISQENLKLIFNEKFTYWPNNSAGGGIGLFEVKNIIDFWGGNIYVESEINKGTTFTIKLPLDQLNKKK